MEEVTKIRPTSDELKIINSCLHCPEEGCSSIFNSESNLTLHLIKTHHQERKLDGGVREYYCPCPDCIYNDEKFFKTLKLLKQHYLKVHGEKSYVCEGCSKGFPTLALKARHTKYCGINFKCCECNATYPSHESLLTHGRRKQHRILDKKCYNPNLAVTKAPSETEIKKLRKGAFILPKSSASLQLVMVLESTLDKEIQTDPCGVLPKLKSKQTQVSNKISRKYAKQSQTSELKKIRSSAETQTIGDYLPKKPKLAVSDPCLNKLQESISQKSIKTQTKQISSKSQSCNTSFEIKESDYISNPIIHRSNSSTQTAAMATESLFSISTATHDSIHTDTSDLNFEFMHSSSQTCLNEDMSIFDSSSFFNCNIETQTDFMFDNELLNYEDAYTNMETQTSIVKDYDIFCNTIHTQTFFDDVARSVESQTMMSHGKAPFLSCRDMAHMETQTDIDFKKLLEEINA